MTPDAQGRFCHSCATTVVDFTKMTDGEVVAWLSKATDRTCGRFRKDQIDKNLRPVSNRTKSFTWSTALFSLVAWLQVEPAQAQKEIHKYVHELPVQPVVPAAPMKELPTLAPVPSTNPRLLKGVVQKLGSKDNLPGVTVMLKGTDIATATDKNGRFELAIPKNLPLQEQVVVFAYIGLIPQEKRLVDLQKQAYPIISMQVDNRMIIGEVIVTGFGNPPSPKGFFQKLKNLFR